VAPAEFRVLFALFSFLFLFLSSFVTLFIAFYFSDFLICFSLSFGSLVLSFLSVLILAFLCFERSEIFLSDFGCNSPKNFVYFLIILRSKRIYELLIN